MPYVGEKCGIAAYIGDNAVEKVYLSLIALQHRGQESAGIVAWKNERFIEYKTHGLVQNVLRYIGKEKDGASPAIGHVRYSTYGGSSRVFIQPVRAKYRDLELYLAHNGTIPNAYFYRGDLASYGVRTVFDLDSGILAGYLAYSIWEYGLREAINSIFERFKASYAFIALIDGGDVLAAKDPYGIRPLSIAISNENDIAISSESCAFNAIMGKDQFYRELLPKESILIEHSGKVKILSEGNKDSERICVFEYVYFARPDSVISGVNVYKARVRMGEILAEEELRRFKRPLAGLVIPVPDSGRAAAKGFSSCLGIRMEEGLIKNRYLGRTFILPDDSLRKVSVRLKLSPIEDVVKGRKIYLVDDSLVRGNTMKEIVKMLFDAGAEEVHVRIASPPIRNPCYFGIDFPTHEELIAYRKSLEEIRDAIGATSLYYLSIEGLKKALGKEEVCSGCFTGIYPIEVTEHGEIKIPRYRKWR